MRLRSWSAHMLSSILSFLFPNPCVVCFKPAGKNRYVCASCKNEIHYIGTDSVCKTCLTPLPSGSTMCAKCMLKRPKYDQLVACAVYKGALRQALHRYKFSGRADLHTSFSLMIWERLSLLGRTDFDVVIPIPLSQKRFKERGYNQAGLIAKDLAKRFGIPVYSDALVKNKHTARQSELRMDERSKNVRGAFFLNRPETIRNKRVLLVDDIFTTGATVREASNVLSQAAENVTVCTVAKAVL